LSKQKKVQGQEDEQQNDRKYIIVGLVSVFLAVTAIFATLLFVGLVLGFCICPFVWPKIRTKLPKFENKKDLRIKELEAKIKQLQEKQA
jgi:uncharacterized membrane protein YciS (DUF1049 family)